VLESNFAGISDYIYLPIWTIGPH